MQCLRHIIDEAIISAVQGIGAIKSVFLKLRHFIKQACIATCAVADFLAP